MDVNTHDLFNLLTNSVCNSIIAWCGRGFLSKLEAVAPLGEVDTASAPYFSMILIYKGDEAWMLPPRSSS